MAKLHDSLNQELREWIARQPMFFVATAAADGRVNLSPKGMDTLRCLDERTVGYLDLTGSGNETAAHLACDGRITLMWCAFDEQPRILRAYGRGRRFDVADPAAADWLALLPAEPGARQVIVIDVEAVQTSCGFGVPLAQSFEARPTLREWAERKGPDGVVAYQRKHNLTSLDGLPTGLVLPPAPDPQG